MLDHPVSTHLSLRGPGRFDVPRPSKVNSLTKSEATDTSETQRRHATLDSDVSDGSGRCSLAGASGTNLSICLSLYRSISQSLNLSISPSVSTSLYLYLSISLSNTPRVGRGRLSVLPPLGQRALRDEDLDGAHLRGGASVGLMYTWLISNWARF